MPSLHIEIRGQSFEAALPDAPVRIGSAPGADLRIHVGDVAAEHCVLEPLANGLHKLSDLRSGYATRVNGIAVKQVSLKDGDVVEVGDARIVYRQADFAVAAAEEAPEAIPAVPAVPARVARAAPATAATSAAPAPTATAAAAPSAAATDAATPTDSAPAAPRRGTSTGEAVTRPRSRKGLKGGLLALGGACATLAVILLAVGGESGDASLASARRSYAEGRRLYEAKDFTGARRVWSALAADRGAGAVAQEAASGLALLGDVEREMEMKLDRLWSERLDLTVDAFAPARENFVRAYGEAQAGRFDALRARVQADQQRWRDEELERVRAEVAESVKGGEYQRASEAWRRLARTAPVAVDVRSEVDEGLGLLEAAADEGATAILERGRAWIDAGQAFRAVMLLEDVLPRFAGLAARARIEAGLEAARAAHAAPARTQPDAGVSPTPEGATPAQPVTLPAPSAAEALAGRLAAADAEAAAQVQERRFGDAAATLTAVAGALPAGRERSALEARADDLRLAGTGLERLVADINARPGRYAAVKLAEHMTVALIEADHETLSAAVTGGRSKHRWARLGPAAFASLAERMAPEKDDTVAVAALLHAVGVVDAAERMLYRAGEKGVDTAIVFAALARWRGEDVPEGGYVVHAQRYVTPAERDHLLLEARIEAALAQVSHRDAATRAAGYAELLAIGEPAQARFHDALLRQRRFVADRLVASKTYAGGKFKARLLEMLAERRKQALALIYDAQAYPYPNPQHKNQAEVEALVDLVREVWERPFDLVAQWDKKLGEHLALVTEVDTVLAKVEPGYKPDLDAIKARINASIDVPAAADAGLREYSLKVLGYNETLETTATREEKDNVRVVNEYRMMMGLPAVKVNERLVRAARGHSRHMQQNGYFAHDVPAPFATPENRSPGARAKRQGYGGGVGENIARGPGTGRGAFMAWFGSSGHHRNMLGRGWLELGCGRAGGTWWTQNFGGGSKSLKAPDPLPAPEPPFAPDPEDESGRPVPSGPAEVPDEVPPGEGEVPPVPGDAPPPDDGK